MNGMGTHQSARMQKDEWLTPPHIISSLGSFDLDPCAPKIRPWDMAKDHYHELGLMKPWHGRIWLNPPYGNMTGEWLNKLSHHNNGVALIFARTDTETFFREVWAKADAVLFIKGRLTFCHIDGTRATANSGAPSCLVAYGLNNVQSLEKCDIKGKLLKING